MIDWSCFICSALFPSSLTNRRRSVRADSVAAAFSCIPGPCVGAKARQTLARTSLAIGVIVPPRALRQLAGTSRKVARLDAAFATPGLRERVHPTELHNHLGHNPAGSSGAIFGADNPIKSWAPIS